MHIYSIMHWNVCMHCRSWTTNIGIDFWSDQGTDYMENFCPGWSFSPVAQAEKKTRLHGKFQPGLKLNARAGIVVFLYLLLYTKVLRMRLWIFSPGWNFLSITWGILARSTVISGSSNRAETPYYKDFIGSLVWTFSPVNLAESSSRAENPHVISP